MRRSKGLTSLAAALIGLHQTAWLFLIASAAMGCTYECPRDTNARVNEADVVAATRAVIFEALDGSRLVAPNPFVVLPPRTKHRVNAETHFTVLVTGHEITSRVLEALSREFHEYPNVQFTQNRVDFAGSAKETPVHIDVVVENPFCLSTAVFWNHAGFEIIVQKRFNDWEVTRIRQTGVE